MKRGWANCPSCPFCVPGKREVHWKSNHKTANTKIMCFLNGFNGVLLTHFRLGQNYCLKVVNISKVNSDWFLVCQQGDKIKGF